MKWPVHEFMIIVEGEVVAVEEDRETVIRAGETFFIPKGRRCIWNQAVYAKKFMAVFDDQSEPPDAADHPIVKIDRELRPSALLCRGDLGNSGWSRSFCRCDVTIYCWHIERDCLSAAPSRISVP